jgi:hypothetical protein
LHEAHDDVRVTILTAQIASRLRVLRGVFRHLFVVFVPPGGTTKDRHGFAMMFDVTP